MIKVIGSVIVLSAAVCLGFSLGQQLDDRIHDIKVLEMVFQELLSDIKYGKITVAESFGRIERKVADPFSRFLKNICGEVKWKRGKSFEEIFIREIDACLKNTALAEKDFQLLKEVGRSIGTPEKESQIRSVEIYLRELKAERESLERIAPDKKKICRTLGISGGIFLLILLL